MARRCCSVGNRGDLDVVRAIERRFSATKPGCVWDVLVMRGRCSDVALSCSCRVPSIGVGMTISHGGAAAFHSHGNEQSMVLFVVVTLALGVGTSWLATSLFNYASHSLPMGLVGQLLILETVFGIAYTCIYHQSLPPCIDRRDG